MSEKKKQEYTTGGLKNRQDVEHALASAEYRPSQKVTDAASDLKQWQANRPGDYESAYQGRIDGLMEDLLDRKEFSYSYGADPLYRQYAQLYTQNAQNASADAAAQAAALTGGYGSSYAASAARQAYQQQIGALSEAIPTLYRLALDTYQSGGEELVNRLDQPNGEGPRGTGRSRMPSRSMSGSWRITTPSWNKRAMPTTRLTPRITGAIRIIWASWTACMVTTRHRNSRRRPAASRDSTMW